MKLTTGTWVVVCDAGKYLLLQNNGNEANLDLNIVSYAEQHTPATRELGTDRPGTFKGYATRRGGPEPTDWHQLNKKDHVKDLADSLNRLAVSQTLKKLIIVSDKRSLGLLRQKLSRQVTDTLIAEIGADYAHRTIEDIEALLTRQ